jgi:hypothetical protein
VRSRAEGTEGKGQRARDRGKGTEGKGFLGMHNGYKDK